MEATVREPDAPSARSLSDLAELRVALVHDWLTGMRGGEKCLEVLCDAFPTATLHTLIHRAGASSAPIESMRIRTSPLQGVPGIFRHYRKLLPLMPIAARSWNVGAASVVVSLSHCVAKSVWVPAGVPHICYCFTPMRYAWQGRAAYAEVWRRKPLRRAVANLMLDRLKDWDRASARSVTHFIAISETVRARILACYGRDSVVIPPPVDTEFYQPSAVRRGDSYLCVSALVPYKRVDQAVLACSRSGRPLDVIGEGPERSRLEQMAGPSVRFLGWQPDSVLRDHYQRCRALLFPGEEDFGIVPMEALACGAPVIALGRGGVAENVDDTVGRTYREPTTEGLLAALESWECDGQPHDPEEGRQRAEALALPLFRARMLDYIAMVGSVSARNPVPVSNAVCR